ncbi:unnamed protein product [Gadus morhua 'NCC']
MGMSPPDAQWDYGQGTLSVDGTNTTVGIFATERGLLLFTQGYTYTAVNPARDLGPRLITALAGWGSGA